MTSDDKDHSPQASGEDAVSDTEIDSFVDSDPTDESEVGEAPQGTEEIEGDESPRRGRAVLLFAAILLVLVGLVGAGAWYWHQHYLEPELTSLRDRIAATNTLGADVASLGGRIDAAGEAAAASVSALESEVSEVGAAIGSVESAQADLRRSISALYEKETQTSVDWILAEAEYLVLAATQRLALERDISTAVAALRAADQRLRSAEHPDLIPIRDQLIKDIAALEGVNRADVEGLALYLAESVGLVDALPTKPIAEEVTPFSTVREGEYKAEDWRKLGYAIWSDLVELVEVKDADLPDSVLFDPELRYFLQQNLKLELASARLAVLRRDKANLEASVSLIKRLLDAYYDEADAGVKSIVARLDEAATMELAPKLPNISGSLDVIRKHRQDRVAGAGSAP